MEDTQLTREELLKQRKRFYYIRHRETMISNAKRWQQENKEKARKIKDDWQKKNIEKVREYNKKYRERQKALKINSTNGL